MEDFDRILRRAIERNASDIHLKAGLPPIIRVHGELIPLEGLDQTAEPLDPPFIEAIAFAIMNGVQQERFVRGEEVDLGYEVSSLGRFRVNACQQRSMPRLVCRHIPEAIPALEHLGLPRVVHELTKTPRGLILVTGANGTGKSTTLAAIIDEINHNRSCHILTVEDPIEFAFRDRKSVVTQREVGTDTAGFTEALKYALRQDPDVILVGEMRDEETMMMALGAAETGHLVLSTLHTTDAAETISRIVGSVAPGMQQQIRIQLASVLVAIISQRLVRRKEGEARVPVIELLLNNVRVRDLILDPARTLELNQVMEQSNNLGMQTFDQSLRMLVQQGQISKEEALANCTNPQDFQLRLRGIVTGEWREKDMSKLGSEYQSIRTPTVVDESSIKIEFEKRLKKK